MFSLIVAHFRSEIFYWLVQKICSLSPQKPVIILFHDHDQKELKVQNLKSNLQDCPLRKRFFDLNERECVKGKRLIPNNLNQSGMFD